MRKANSERISSKVVETNPSDTMVRRTAPAYSRGDYCAIVAIGGGSVVGAAKGAILLATHGGGAWAPFRV
jgi:alcohol dehydrogenase class IV